MIGLVVAGVASGVGKTTLTLGLIGALKRRGLTVQPFKVGPDYIDPSQHAQVAGRPSRNLDSWMVPEQGLRELFVRAARTADVAIVEGVMGLFDGRTGAGEIGSTAHVAKLLGLPVLLVIDATKAGRTMAAAALGCRMVDPAVNIVGVVLNNVASERHAGIGREAVETLAGLPVLGCIMRDGELRQEERYLGLVPGAERQVSRSLVERATARVEAGVDLDRLTRLATVDLADGPASGLFPARSPTGRVRIATAHDEAFSFYYQDSLDLLEAWGAELVPFSPLRDERLPEQIGGVYLGGGFPELFAIDLAVNSPMLASIRDAARRGLPIYAECGGLMYLQVALIDADGRRHRMVGLVPGTSALVGKRLTLGYREAIARQESPLAVAGRTVRGHEFHWSVCDPPAPESAAYEIADGSGRVEGYASGNVLASYIHVHLASDLSLAPRFVRACAGAENKERGGWSLSMPRAISTARAIAGSPEIDLLGRDEEWKIEASAETLKAASAAIVADAVVAVYQDAGEPDPLAQLPAEWPRVESLEALRGWPGPRLAVTDRLIEESIADDGGPLVLYRPPTLVLGVGCSAGAPAHEIEDLARTTVAEAGFAWASVAAVETLDRRFEEPGVQSLIRQARGYGVGWPADRLNAVTDIPTPSDEVARQVGTAGVCEAAAILGSDGGELVVSKRKSAHATVAVARRATGRATALKLSCGEWEDR